jgi:pimeloyl-ACP methyl ester carboxylesterase
MMKTISRLIICALLAFMEPALAKSEHYLYDKNNTRFQLVKSVPGDKALNWAFLPGGPGVDSKYLIDLINTLHMPGNYWLIDLPDNGTNIQNKDLSPERFENWGGYLVDALTRFENPVLVGHSFGGYLPLFCPELESVLAGFVILNSTPTLHSEIFANIAQEHHLPSLEDAQALFVKNKNTQALQSLYVLESEYFFAPEYREKGINQIIKKLEFSIPAEYWWYTQGVKFYSQITWVPQKIPTLIIGGSNDYITPLAVFENDNRFKRGNITLHLLEDAGHFPWLEQPNSLNESLMRFTKISL